MNLKDDHIQSKYSVRNSPFSVQLNLINVKYVLIFVTVKIMNLMKDDLMVQEKVSLKIEDTPGTVLSTGNTMDKINPLPSWSRERERHKQTCSIRNQ